MNRAPIFFTREQAADFGFNPDRSVKEQAQQLVETHQSLQSPSPAPESLEQRINEGFASRHDEALMKAFHRADWPDRAAIADQFEDERFRLLAYRLIFVSQPSFLKTGQRRNLEIAIARRLHVEHENADLWSTLPTALREAEEMAEQGDAEDLQCVYRAYL